MLRALIKRIIVQILALYGWLRQQVLDVIPVALQGVSGRQSIKDSNENIAPTSDVTEIMLSGPSEKVEKYAPLLAFLKPYKHVHRVGSCSEVARDVFEDMFRSLIKFDPKVNIILDLFKVVAVQVLFDGNPAIKLNEDVPPLSTIENVTPFKKYENTSGLWMRDDRSEDKEVLQAPTHYVVLCKLKPNGNFVILDGNEAQFTGDDRVLLQGGKMLRDCESVMYITVKEFEMEGATRWTQYKQT
eukprot:CAMPEP_0181348446 /NCGR_PEP_ID=MMETSP1106-20121128/179_1 /TAXON_ID=81844 /ORGANISM="Mantoniella antarctica, Strain SL-175" /LENGTH=242 /DNA_ID=CAMNT_0023460737 /DNA_START=225 /DNA_END=953 /DNA_ORIENTATION=-